MPNRSITVGHVQDFDDTYGGRHNGFGMEHHPVGDRGWLGNPWSMKAFSGLPDHEARRVVILMYAGAFDYRQQNDRDFKYAVQDLDGDLVSCYCRHAGESGPPCHLDVVDHFLRGSLPDYIEWLATEWTPGEGGYDA